MRIRVMFETALASLPLLSSAATAQSVWFVDSDARPGGPGTSWADAFVDLQEALSAAAGGDAIWVAEGLYKPDGGTGGRSASFLLPGGVAVYGGFAGDEKMLEQRDPALHVTVLSGDLAGNDAPGASYNDSSLNDNSYHVVSVLGAAKGIVLDGFTIRSGHADTNPASNRGGGLFNGGGDVLAVNCEFTANSAAIGGAVYNAAGSPAFSSCRFVGNFGDDGAAAFNDAGSSPTYESCVFDDTVAFENTVWNMDCNATFLDCSFSGNTAPDPSGFPGMEVLYNQQGANTIVGCSFTNNGGLAIRNWGGTPIISGCLLLGNGPDGAISAESQSVAFIADCTIDSNYGLDDEASGGLWITNGAPLVVNSTFFGNSSAFEGGAVRSLGAPVLIGCRFIFNASGRGGAFFNQRAHPLLINCLFAENYADTDGGAFFNVAWPSPALPVFSNCTFAGNIARNRGGALCSESKGPLARPTVTNSVLWGNLAGGAAGEAAQVALIDGSTVELNYSCVEGLSGALGGEGNIGADPLLSAGDYRLTAGSPCIDAASSPMAATDVLDLDGDGDVLEPLDVDLEGNPRFLDDPASPDRGCGAVVIDMGAYEFPGLLVEPIDGDVDGDGVVGITDLLLLLGTWGPCGPCCPADIDGDEAVGITDLLVLLAAWSGG